MDNSQGVNKVWVQGTWVLRGGSSPTFPLVHRKSEVGMEDLGVWKGARTFDIWKLKRAREPFEQNIFKSECSVGCFEGEVAWGREGKQ